jgi:ankyrin repeat protein
MNIPPMTDSRAIDAAYRQGDLEGLKAALGDPPDFPNVENPPAFGGGACLESAIYHSPLAFLRTLLELGADPNYPDSAGFPSLIAALSSGREDALERVALLLDAGADIGQRGLNDWTPLHYAAANDDVRAIELLMERGADPAARTNVDDYATPLEEAEILGRRESVRALKRLTPG